MKKFCCACTLENGNDLSFGLMESQDWLTLAEMPNNSTPPSFTALKILPAYTGLNTVEEILQISRARRLLWLEILFNDQFDFKSWQYDLEVQEAYRKPGGSPPNGV